MKEYEFQCDIKGVMHGVVHANSEIEAIIKAEQIIMEEGYTRDGEVDIFETWDEWENDYERA